MNDFVYYSPTRVIFGRAAVSKLGALLKSGGYQSILLHYGSGSIKENGIHQAVVKQLCEAGIAYTECGGVQPNPKIGLVYEGIRICREKQVDFILAVGGGSVIDSAKAIALGAKLQGDVWELYMTKRRVDAALPVGSVLTLSAAGSELSGGSVITNPEGNLKRDYGIDALRPVFAIMNPEYTFTVSPYQTACGIVDIMMHTMERYFTPTTDVDLTDELCEGLLRAVMRAGVQALDDPRDYQARATLMWAGSLSHNDLTGTGRQSDWATHQMEHELSGMYDSVAHGAGLAVLFPAWAKYVMHQNPARFARFAKNVHGMDSAGMSAMQAGLQGILRMEAFFQSLGMPTRLSDLGVDGTHIDEMAEKATFFGKRTLGSFQTLGKEDIAAIYRLALS